MTDYFDRVLERAASPSIRPTAPLWSGVPLADAGGETQTTDADDDAFSAPTTNDSAPTQPRATSTEQPTIGDREPDQGPMPHRQHHLGSVGTPALRSTRARAPDAVTDSPSEGTQSEDIQTNATQSDHAQANEGRDSRPRSATDRPTIEAVERATPSVDPGSSRSSLDIDLIHGGSIGNRSVDSSIEAGSVGTGPVDSDRAERSRIDDELARIDALMYGAARLPVPEHLRPIEAAQVEPPTAPSTPIEPTPPSGTIHIGLISIEISNPAPPNHNAASALPARRQARASAHLGKSRPVGRRP